jgi:hypothetical protein
MAPIHGPARIAANMVPMESSQAGKFNEFPINLPTKLMPIATGINTIPIVVILKRNASFTVILADLLSE